MQLLGILIELRGEGAANAGIYIDILGALELVALLYLTCHIKIHERVDALRSVAVRP